MLRYAAPRSGKRQPTLQQRRATRRDATRRDATRRDATRRLAPPHHATARHAALTPRPRRAHAAPTPRPRRAHAAPTPRNRSAIAALTVCDAVLSHHQQTNHNHLCIPKASLLFSAKSRIATHGRIHAFRDGFERRDLDVYYQGGPPPPGKHASTDLRDGFERAGGSAQPSNPEAITTSRFFAARIRYRRARRHAVAFDLLRQNQSSRASRTCRRADTNCRDTTALVLWWWCAARGDGGDGARTRARAGGWAW